MDYCFHHGNINDFSEHLKAGDFRKVADIMLEDTKKPAFKARPELRSDYVYYNTLHFDGVHIVWSGETFGGIAKKHGINSEALKELNPQLEKNFGKLSVGQKIYISDDAAQQFQTGAHKPSPTDTDGHESYSQSEASSYFISNVLETG